MNATNLDRAPFAGRAATPLSALVALISVGGIALPATYARETASWAAQAVGQDWFDLLVAVPWLAVAGAVARRASRRALLLLGGGLAYAVYELVLYAFAVRFNALFLLYCAALGLALFALGALLAGLVGQDARRWYGERVPARVAGGWLIAIGAVFALLWLAEIVPASLRGAVPPSVAEAAVPTNPVHAMDLAFVLPAHVLVGLALLRRRSAGYALGPIMLAFDALMAASIAGMMVVMRARGLPAPVPVMGTLAALSAASAVLVALMLRQLGTGVAHSPEGGGEP